MPFSITTSDSDTYNSVRNFQQTLLDAVDKFTEVTMEYPSVAHQVGITYNGYSRAPSITEAFIRDYIPFKIFAIMMSASKRPLNDREPKGIRPTLFFHRVATPDTIANLWSRRLSTGLAGGFQEYRHQETRNVHVVHCTSDTYAATKDMLDALEDYIYDDLISSLIIPGSGFSVRSYLPKEEFKDALCPIVLIDKINPALLTKLIALMPAMMRVNLNTLGYPCTPAMMQSLLTLDEKGFVKEAVPYLNAIWEDYIKNEEAVSTKRRQEVIDGFAPRIIQMSTAHLDRDIASREQSIASYEQELRNYYKMLYDLRLARNAYTSEGIEMFIDLMKKTADLKGVDYDGSKMKLYVATKLASFDTAAAEKVAASYARQTGDRSKLYAKMITALFVKEEFQIPIVDAGYLNLSTGELGRVDDETLRTVRGKYKGFYNRHIHTHNCWGGNASVIQKAIAQQDYSTAFMQMMSAFRNVNVLDTGVFQSVLEEIAGIGDSKLIIRKSTGERISFNEFKKEI